MSALHETMAAVTALAAAIAGFASLSLGIDRHWEALHGRGTDPGIWRRRLQWAGAAGLLVSLLACVALRGGAQGWVAWAGMMTAAALTVVLTLTYLPQRLPPLAKAMGAVALLAALAMLAGA